MNRRASTSRIAIAALLTAASLLAGCGGSGTGMGTVSGMGSPTGTASQSPNETGASSAPAAVALAVKDNTPVDPAIVAADNAFGLRLLDTLLPGSNGGNIAISPTSASLALQILYNGAAGSTQQAMTQTLDLGSLTVQALNDDNAALQASLSNADPAVQVLIANSLWLNQASNPVLPSFTQMDQTYYGATVGDLGDAPDNVNAWVANETQGLITQLLPPGVYKDAIIANVLYFKGQWTTQFDATKTAAAPFTLSDGTQTSAPLMHLTASFAYATGALNGSSYQAIRIPYGQDRFSMFIILPDASADITNFVALLSAADLSNVAAQLQPTMVDIGLPRFTASYQASLIEALQALGMGAALTPTADFSALAPGFWAKVVEHKTVVEVDETGTVAAAATGVGLTSIVSSQNNPMIMDHPFFYAIEDGTTGALLFMGVLMNPSGQ